MKLTDTLLRAVKPSEKSQKLADGGGLYLFVAPTGGKLWRMDYRFAGKRKTFSLGPYPAVSLKDARARRDEAKAQLAAGIDPGANKKALKAAVIAETQNSFEVVAREWHAKKKSAWVSEHAKKILARLEKYVFPVVGTMPVSTITAPELLTALRRIESTGATETAHRTLQTCGQIFRYAIATGRAERDTAADLKDALEPAKKGSFPTITNPTAIGQLLRNIDNYHGNLIVRSALRLAPLVFVRPGELRYAEWSEINADASEWRIPAARMKMREMHIVPLSQQALAILEELRPYTGYTRFLFPGMRTQARPISDATLLNALRSMGYDKDTLVVHSFRSVASTLLHEQGFNKDWIERQLAHGERNTVRATYNHAEYLPERRKMMQAWSDYLEILKIAKKPADC